MIIDKNGFYTITDKEYHADPCPTPSFSSGMAQAIIEKTEIEAMLSSQRLNPNYRDKKSDVMDLGVIAEDFILKGEENTFEIAPFDDWRTNAAKEARAQIEAKGLVALNNTTGERLLGDVREMKRRLFEQLGEHNDYPELLQKGKAQQSGFMVENGVWNRAKFDWIDESYTDLIADYKTTGLGFDQWEKNELWGGKYMQSVHYRRVYGTITNTQPRFVFLVQQTFAPFLIKIIELAPEYAEQINMRYFHALNKFSACLTSGKWHGIPPYTFTSYPPPWVVQKWDNEELSDAAIKTKTQFNPDTILAG